MSPIALVTGGAGFIGSHLCRRLLAEDYSVRVLDDLSDGDAKRLENAPEVDLVVGDVRDAPLVHKLTTDCTSVFHLAARKSVQRSLLEPSSTTSVNVLGTLNVLLAAKEEGAPVVAASSSSVYGDQTEYPVREDATLKPMSPYGASKVALEAYSATYWRVFRVPTVALRYFNVYGPGQPADGSYAAVVPRFIQACLENANPTVYGDGRQVRTFSYVDDVVAATVAAAGASPAFGKAINIAGSEPPISVLDVLWEIARSCGVAVQPRFQAAREGDIGRSEPDVGQAKRLLGFESQVGFKDGIDKTVAWYRGHERREPT